MASSIKVRLSPGEVQAMLRGPNGPVARDIYRRGKRVEGRAKRLAPVDTGRLRASISTEMLRRDTPTARVGTNVKYATFVHFGTGLYGPRGALIRPVRASVMVFTPRGGSPVFTRFTRGVRPRPFLQDALPAAL